METKSNERRQFERNPVNIGLLFSDYDNLIGIAKVVDISKGGVRCVSLSQVMCTICEMENIELLGADESISLTGLSGKMIRCSDDAFGSDSQSKIIYYEFGFEFLSPHYPRVNQLMRSLSI